MEFEQSGVGSPHCRVCDSSYESVTHLVSSCPIFADIREKILIEIEEKLQDSKNGWKMSTFLKSDKNPDSVYT